MDSIMADGADTAAVTPGAPCASSDAVWQVQVERQPTPADRPHFAARCAKARSGAKSGAVVVTDELEWINDEHASIVVV